MFIQQLAQNTTGLSYYTKTPFLRPFIIAVKSVLCVFFPGKGSGGLCEPRPCDQIKQKYGKLLILLTSKQTKLFSKVMSLKLKAGHVRKSSVFLLFIHNDYH